MHLATVAQKAAVPFTAASRGIGAGVHSLGNFVKLEAVVTTLCVFIPFLVIAGDGWNVREHISGYYSMERAEYFYYPLTVAAMLFMVNGVVRDKHWYNFALGLALSGVVLFNHVDFNVLHNLSAGAFFIGNAFVFVLFTPRHELWFKIALWLVMAISLAGYFVFHWYSLFVAETVSLWVIALHFFLESKGWIE